jgi:Peptidase family M48
MHLSLRSRWAPALLLALAGCQTPQVEPAYPQGYAPGQYAPGQYPAGQLPPPGYAPGQPQGYLPQGQGYGAPPGYAAPGYGQPPGYAAPGQAPPPGYAAPPGYGQPPGYAAPGQAPPPGYVSPAAPDPINLVDLEYLRGTARSVLGELVEALPPAQKARVQGIPFRSENKVGDVNAYAGCDQRQPFMAVTDGLLQIEAYMAQLKATDEIFGGQKLDGYLQMMAKYQKPDQPVVTPPQGYVDPAQQVDPRKVARQHQLLEEQLAFVLGHELGHHHLGHTGCANGQSGDRPITLGDIGRIVNKVLPPTNQYNEMAADAIGVDDLLAAGARRPGYRWTEGGALLTLHFFATLQRLTLESLAMSFLSSHPNPALRIQPVQQEAARFRATGQWYQPPLPQL